jgi:hypothetical protein
MYKGSVRFESAVEGIDLPKVTVTPAEPLVERIEIEAPLRKPMEIRVHLHSVASIGEAIVRATRAVEDVVDRLAFTLMVSVGDPRYVDHALSDMDAGGTGSSEIMGQQIPLDQILEYSVRPNTAQLQALEDSLVRQRATLPGQQFMTIFRSALKVRDPVGRFLCLYSILLLRNSDDQKRVDQFIRAEEPGVTESQSPHFKQVVFETVYTRLRNEFGHARKGTSFDQTRKEMELHLGGLRRLAQKACLIP